MCEWSYDGVEVFKSILWAVALWLFATLLLGVTIGLAWGVAHNVARLMTG